MNPESPSHHLRNEKMFRWFSYGLVFLLMTCVVMTIVMIVQHVSGWHAGFIAGLLVFIVIDRLYTYRHLKPLTLFSSEWAIAVGGQWILILLLTRLLLSYANGLDSFRADLAQFARGNLVELFTFEFLFSILLALLIWYLTGRFLDVLEEIGLNPALALHENPPLQSEATPAHQRLVSLIFSIGIGLVILTALARLNFDTIVSNVQGIPRIEFSRLSGGEAGALLYFVFGLALLSLSRLMSLQTHWNRLRIPVSSRNLTRQWGIYSLVFLLLLAIFVSLLPAGDTFGFFSVLGTLLSFLAGIIFFIGQLLLGLIFILISIPFMLLGGDVPDLNLPPPPPRLTNLPVPEAPPVTNSAAWAFLRSVLLWGSLAVLLVFVFLQFVRQHGGLRAALRQSRLTNWLYLAWQWLSRNAAKTGQGLARVIAEGWQNMVSRLETGRVLPPSALLRLRALNPRQQIYFYYLALLRRSEEYGWGRKPSQTPSEYAAALRRALPEAEGDIDAMTRAFAQARYSRKEVVAGDARGIKDTWGRVRRALQIKFKEKRSKGQ